MLFIGMGTEVVVFFLSAFDRPFDKEEIGKVLPHDVETDEEIAAHLDEEEEEEDREEEEDKDKANVAQTASNPTPIQQRILEQRRQEEVRRMEVEHKRQLEKERKLEQQRREEEHRRQEEVRR